MIERNGWYKSRRYRHFDRPVGLTRARAYVTDPRHIPRHAFLPFIEFSIRTPRYDRVEKKAKIKERCINFAAHMDSHIFAYYSRLLSQAYEAKLSAFGIPQCPTAYRSLGKSNIDFAHEIFSMIRRRGSCTTIAMDVEDFFGSMNHALLKDAWCQVLDVPRLPDDHYAVFRAVTRYASVNQSAMLKLLEIGRRQLRTTRDPLCTPQDFRDVIRRAGLIKRHKSDHGIPQGSPISATLSNIYLLAFDKSVASALAARSAVYRRYSDDIIVLCDTSDDVWVQQIIKEQLLGARLKTNEGKTQTSVFCGEPGQPLTLDHPLQYLGFEFDGTSERIRPGTLANFYRRMKKGVRSAKRAARAAASKGKRIVVFRHKLYEHFTHLGRKNFPSYAKRAQRTMKSDAIRKQMKRHWRALHEELEKKRT